MQLAILTYTALGVGAVIGPIPMGLIQDKYGHKACIFYILINNIGFTLLIMFLNEKL